jgi:hypothetical protein
MYQKLVSHNSDLAALAAAGYAIAFDSNFLVVRDIPYLDAAGQLQWGAFVTALEFIDQTHVRQHNHQVYFAGGAPHGLDGRPIPNLGIQNAQVALSQRCADLVIQYAFSHALYPYRPYEDFFAKIESYVAVVAGPAMNKHGANPKTYRVDRTAGEGSVFKFHDTLTSRAEITVLAKRFENEVIALIGLGGTGGYLLDFAVKSPVKEIRAFDSDSFHVHNAFRSPGRLSEEELGMSKAAVYRSRYENFRHGLHIHDKFIDETCVDDLEGVTFAFVCVDKGTARAAIFDLLIEKGIPFIDVGMGLSQKNGELAGMARVTYYPSDRAAALRELKLAEMNDTPENVYRANIQVGELNALNASLALIRYKQLMGFYRQDDSRISTMFNISDLGLTGDSHDEV